MRSFIVLSCLLFSFSVLAKDKLQPSVFEVIPLNSPVKGSTAKFNLKLPTGFEVDKIKVKLVNANDLRKDQKKFEDINVVNNNELNVAVSKLPPGFYQLYVKVWDKKNKGEHDFKTKFHDFVRFVIDESLQVPMPDPTKNNATIAGVDSDGDGIRDDIQRWLNENFSSTPNVRLALRQYAIGIQNTLVNKDNKQNSINASLAALRAQSCSGAAQRAIGTSSREIMETNEKVRALFTNTKERIEAKFKVSENFHGQTIEILSAEEACNFNF